MISCLINLLIIVTLPWSTYIFSWSYQKRLERLGQVLWAFTREPKYQNGDSIRWHPSESWHLPIAILKDLKTQEQHGLQWQRLQKKGYNLKKCPFPLIHKQSLLLWAGGGFFFFSFPFQLSYNFYSTSISPCQYYATMGCWFKTPFFIQFVFSRKKWHLTAN